MKRFLNLPERVVDEVLGSFVQLAPVTLSAPGKGVRIVARADWKKDRVALISGGGAGHEPAHAGFVGEGMLTAAVSGELFASPSVDAVLAAIRHVTGSPGCLLIVKNYTGDRLNFGLAAERARAEGLNVGVVIVGDDVALEKSVKPRGIAGTVLVHKYAGWMAAKGLGLDEILTRITAFAELPMTLGLALSGCDVPGRAAETGGHGPELGLGIHNEPGAQEVNPASAREAMQLVLTPLLAEAVRRDPAPETRYVAFLNNLGGCSTQEMGVLAHDLLDIAGVERLALMVAPSSLMTSLNMPGFSVTLLPAQSDFVEALSSPTNAPAWPGVLTLHKTQYFEPAVDYLDKGKPDVSSGASVEQNPSVVAAISRITEVLISSKEELDSLDMKVGDGDAGTTIAAGSQTVRLRLQAGTLHTADPSQLCSEIGSALSLVMGGSGGVLLSIFFTATGTSLGNGVAWPDALADGIKRMQDYGGASVGDRTMLDALIPAVQALQHQGLAEAAHAARSGADSTAGMKKAHAGRSAYVPESALTGVVDPGAEAVARAFAAMVATS